MDLPLLTKLPAATTVLIPRYPSPNFRNRLRAAGVANVVEVPRLAAVPLNEHDDWLTSIPEQSPMCHDSAVPLCAANFLSERLPHQQVGLWLPGYFVRSALGAALLK